MDPPGNILLNNTVTQDSANSPSLSNLNDTDGNQSGLANSDPVQSSSSTVPVGPTSKAPQLVTHIDDDCGPRFKDQTNSVAHDGNVNNGRMLTARVAAMNVAGPTTSSKQDDGPNYKDQVNDSSNEVFLSSNRVSPPNPNNSNSNNSNTHSAPMVPIVHGILIPPEMLTDEERRLSGQEVTNRPPIGSETYPNTTNTSHDVNTSSNRQNQSDHQSEKKFSQSPPPPSSKDEHMFWMKIIFGAIFFNTLLVAAVIVGTFCGIGLCSSGSEAYDVPVVNAPAASPLSPTTKIPISASPSLPPTSLPTLVPRPPSVGGTFPVTESPVSFSVTSAPSRLDGDTDVSNPPSGAPSYVPSKTPIFVAPPTVTDSGRGTKLIAFIVPAVILEFIIVLVCLYYYYQRRSQRQSKAELEQPQNEEKENVNESLPPEDSRSVLTA